MYVSVWLFSADGRNERLEDDAYMKYDNIGNS